MTFSEPSGVDKVLTLPTHELDGKKVSQIYVLLSLKKDTRLICLKQDDIYYISAMFVRVFPSRCLRCYFVP